VYYYKELEVELQQLKKQQHQDRTWNLSVTSTPESTPLSPPSSTGVHNELKTGGYLLLVCIKIFTNEFIASAHL